MMLPAMWSAAAADPALTFEINAWFMGCYSEQVEVSAGSSADWGTDVSVYLPGEEPIWGWWWDPGFLEPGTPIEQTVMLSSGQEATVAMTPELGEPQPIDRQFEVVSNHNYREEGYFQEINGTGTVTIDEGTPIPLTDCDGSRQLLTTWSNQPSSDVFHDTYESVVCNTSDGDLGYRIGLNTYDATLWVGAEVADVAGGVWQPLYYGEAVGAEDGSSRTAVVPLNDSDGEPAGEVIVSAEVAVGHPQRSDYVGATFTDTELLRPYLVSGTATFPDGMVVDLAQSECQGGLIRTSVREIYPANPPASVGPAPPNDDWTEAETLRYGIPVNSHNKAAALLPEAECVATPPWGGEPVPVTLGHTLWYQIDGTGEPILVTTDGSNFTTVLGVYVASDDEPQELQQQACATGMFEERSVSQVSLTMDTQAGVTYYVQAGGGGGCDPEVGRLRIEIRPA